MKHFQRLSINNGFANLLHEIVRQPELWNANPQRQNFHPESPHREVEDIWLRFQDLTKSEDLKAVADDHESINYPAMFKLPSARPILFSLMGSVYGERLGRVMITKLAPGGKIHPHVDGGEHAEYYDRYHVILSGYPGSMFRAEDEEVQMLTGEVWWFQNGVEHEVVNNSSEDRIHMIVDIRTTR